ncbi:MAG: AI-2E family transporter [Leptospiraceae bacterium]|nr:AI-2E family transporter [Leptospiraceae bacterium]MDW7976282.1 AI-2E family transporter [Leptospiraceae bacterium]
MNDNTSTKNFQLFFQILILMLILLGSVFLAFYTLRAFFWSFLIAVLLYSTLDGYNKKLQKTLKNKDLASLASIVVIITLIITPLSIFFVLLVQQIIDFVFLVREGIETGSLFLLFLHFDSLVEFFTKDSFFWVTFLNRLDNFLMEYGSYLDRINFPTIVGGAYNVFLLSLEITLKIIVYLLFGFLILYFLFRDGDKLYNTLLDISPFDRELIDELKNQIKLTMSSILLGNVLIAILQGFFLALGFFVTGIPNVILYGFIASLVSVIPVIGTGFVWIPASLYLYFIKKDLIASVVLGLYCYASYLILENIVKPKILDKKLGISSVVLFFAILGGLKEFGAVGIVLGPLILSVFIILWRTITSRKLKKESEIASESKNGN